MPEHAVIGGMLVSSGWMAVTSQGMYFLFPMVPIPMYYVTSQGTATTQGPIPLTAPVKRSRSTSKEPPAASSGQGRICGEKK